MVYQTIHIRRRFQAAFTLIELLVVISIVAMLVALMLPSLKRARDSGRTIQCASNLRQTGIGLENYANTNRGCMPAPALPAETNRDWFVAIGAQGHFGNTVEYSGFGHTAPHNPVMLKGWRIMECPAETGIPKSNGRPYYRMANGRSSYAMNQTFAPYTSAGVMVRGRLRTDWFLGPRYKGTSVIAPLRTPSAAPLIMDMSGEENIWGQQYFTTHLDTLEATNPGAYAEYQYAFRHNQATNMMYWDGHVKTSKHRQESGVALFKTLYDRTTYTTDIPTVSIR
jgi:prepilin-type N-terminal cleavage/methylation domain-containing protein/prepilin-type processing-associated H-X9-DG protein